MEKNLRTLSNHFKTGISTMITIIKIILIFTFVLCMTVFITPLMVLIMLIKRLPTFSEIRKWHHLVILENKK